MSGELTAKLLARVWTDHVPSVERVKVANDVAQILGVDDLSVTQVQRLTPAKELKVAHQAASRSGWAVTSAVESLDVMHVPDPAGAENGEGLGDFVQTAARIFEQLIDEGLASRVAVVREVLLREMSDEEMNSVASALLRFPPRFAPAPWEWDWRCVTTVERNFGGVTEPANTLVTVRRQKVQFVGTGEGSDRIQVTFDTSTEGARMQPRFGREPIVAFVRSAADWLTELEEELRSFALGGLAR